MQTLARTLALMRGRDGKKALRECLPFLIVAVVGLAYHVGMLSAGEPPAGAADGVDAAFAVGMPIEGDDVFFRDATRGATLLEYLSDRYATWTSRVVSEAILVSVIQVPWLWLLIDFLLFATLPVLMGRLAGGGAFANWCAAAAALLFPFHDMGTAGWITTTVTHFWPFWGFFFLLVLLQKMARGERVSAGGIACGTLVCIVTCSHEVYAVMFFAMLLLSAACGIWSSRRDEGFSRERRDISAPRRAKAGDGEGFSRGRRDLRAAQAPRDGRAALAPRRAAGRIQASLFLPLFFAGIASLAVILLCPGNAGRNAVSVADLPVYGTFGFGDKLYLGLLGVERVFLANADAAYVAAMLAWAALSYIKTRNFWKTLLSSAPLLILFGQTVLRTAYPGLSGLFVVPGEVLSWSWSDLSTWIPMTCLAAAAASMAYALFLILGDDPPAFLCALGLIGLGFAASVAIGFAATIYVSGERVYAPLYGALAAVTLFCLGRMRGQAEPLCKSEGGRLFLVPIAALCATNVLFIALSV